MADGTDDRSIESRWQAATGRLRGLLDDSVALTPGLRSRVAAQTAQYRTTGTAALSSPADADAYLATRMAPTMAAAGAAMRAVVESMPSWVPRTLLDAGAGSGSAAWAACATWPTLTTVISLDRSEPMLAHAARLASASGIPALEAARWMSSDVRHASLEPADLVTAGYLLGELAAADRGTLVDRLWGAANGVLIIVEAGSPDGFARIRAARARLIAAGATIAAPCPHDGACPMQDPDWCHFGARLPRSRLHRRAKEVTLPYEDEPYAYLAATREPVDRAARVLTRPSVRKGAIGLRLCTPDGIHDRVVSRREGSAFREARHARWGSRFES
jgi:ribosomal protein RSM22 (predicted rRNA methylase)